MRNTTENAQLALLLEVSGTPKPGNVDRHHEYEELRFEHFMAGAVGARQGLQSATEGTSVGSAFERAVNGMSDQSGGNTQFGALLALIPLVSAVATDRLTSAGVTAVVEATTIEDACAFYRAFEHVDVAVDDPPDGIDDLDVRRGSEAIEAIDERRLTLFDIMELSSDRDGVAGEWTSGFERCFEAAGWLLSDSGPVYRRASRAFIRLLAAEPDTFVATRNSATVADEVTERARAVLDGSEDPDELAAEFVARDINPGTTADLTAAALFIALERGMEV